ncbi:MAG: nuclear transport factor 2 family protein [Hyphomicrobium sp.]|jgi:ketosteroid isomerase-like protein
MITEELTSVRLVTEGLFLALRRRDATGVAACYDQDAVFSSPIIGDVRGADVEALWRAIFAATCDSTLSFTIVDLGLTSARVEGIAKYSLLASGRSVTSRFNSALHIRDLRVMQHDDNFDAWAWASMALGPTGLLLGWSKAWRRRMVANTRLPAALHTAELSARN